MLKLFLIVASIIGIWYGLPTIWSGANHIISERLSISNWYPCWIHAFTLIVIYAAFKVKGK